MKLIEELDFESFINDYADLIDTGSWKELYDILWTHRKTDVADFTSMMIEEGADIPLDICKVLFGIKKYDSTLSLRGTIDGGKTYGANFTSNQGMKGGHMIAFRSILEAEAFRDNLHDGKCYIYALNPKTVTDYDWRLINTKYGPCYASKTALNSFQLINRTIHPWSHLESSIRKKKKEIENLNIQIDVRGVHWQDRRKASQVLNKLDYRLDVSEFIIKRFPDLVGLSSNIHWGRFSVDSQSINAYLYDLRWNELMRKLGYTPQNFDEQSPYTKAEIVEAVREYLETSLNSNKFPEIISAKVTPYQAGPDFFDIQYNIDSTPTIQELFQKEIDKLVSPEDQQARVDDLTREKIKLQNEIADLKQQVKDLKKQTSTP